MGQTLPNGIYLPAEGERNCYDGLEGNWRSVDSLISTVAGKASATHTHGNITNDGKVGTDANKPLITGTGGAVQAGSFGTAANTFCEGNDSRLSDARTPVAHTHTKSDVTDLLNSNFIPSANNSYDLGSSSYQWNNLYAKKVNTQSVNGINPGALSLPKIVAKNTANIASAIVGADGETQYLDGTDNNYTAALDGWISICISGFVNNELWITVYDQQDETWGTSAESSTRNTMFIIFPVRANQKMRIRMKCTSVTYARFYPCEGNV